MRLKKTASRRLRPVARRPEQETEKESETAMEAGSDLEMSYTTRRHGHERVDRPRVLDASRRGEARSGQVYYSTAEV